MGEILLNAFVMATVGHQSPGLWRHPRDRTTQYNTLGYWTHLARVLERGLFDGMFLADVLGAYDVYGGGPESALRHGTQVPLIDPMLLVPAMAAVTRNLGFGITANLSYEAPALMARRFSTLDALTEGRVGWNVVTGYLDSAARAVGRSGQAAHDDRYDLADDYMAAIYQLWEGSWDDDAVVRDGAMYTDPARVRRVTYTPKINHQSVQNVQIDALHLCEPTPQRTPVIYQAGSSPRGLQFAGRHAEAVFISGPTTAVIGPRAAAVRAAVAAQGRRVRIFAMATAILGETEAEARAKLDDFRKYANPDGGLTLYSGWSGIDFSGQPLDTPVRHIANETMRTAIENMTRADPNRVWTLGEVANHVSIGGVGPVFVGTPAQVADAMEAFIEATGVDGFNMAHAISPEAYENIADLLVPELQARGRYKRAYAPGTLRQKLFGGPARLTHPHPAAAARPAARAAAE